MENKTHMHPAIGQLCRKGKTIYYAYINGQYLEGSVPVLTKKLETALVQPFCRS